ncbi:SDR family NAD(P)-dependent oxidoreductase [Mycobacterium kyogaense]|uniref:SDR family NAD(P)-dependent oxidoreductase n=1 Tax=Mycobacterium kyogaense TaxID=2212479 RepID=UPI002FFB7B80
MGSLDGKKAVVTGASRGIGAAIARRLAGDGAAVALTYERSADAAQAVVSDITRDGGRAVAVRMSAGETASVRQAVDDAVTALGGLDILVNNAGVLRGGPIEQLSVRGVMVATLAALPHLGAGGRIISTGSNLATRVPDPGSDGPRASRAISDPVVSR